MPNKNYVNGRAYEYRVKKEYEDSGYLVYRTAGSHSSIDLIAFSPESRLLIFIQCKKGKISIPERLRIYDENEHLGMDGIASYFELRTSEDDKLNKKKNKKSEIYGT